MKALKDVGDILLVFSFDIVPYEEQKFWTGALLFSCFH